ncbi:MAG: hypothetical protein ACXU8U_03205 [Asticcacaulis sp.]
MWNFLIRFAHLFFAIGRILGVGLNGAMVPAMKLVGLNTGLPRRSKPFRPNRSQIERAAIIPSVVAGHVLFFVLLGWQMQTPAPILSGNHGRSVSVDLVSAALFSSNVSPVRTATAKAAAQIAKSAPAKLTPQDDGEAPDAVADVLSPSAETPDQRHQVALSDADATALAAFTPDASQGDPALPCNLTPILAQDMTRNPLVRQGLDELPRTERSVANAVMMWDGQWPEETLRGGKALLRALLVREISASAPNCRQNLNHGPVFFLVPEGEGTAVIAVGSGDWSWNDLLN